MNYFRVLNDSVSVYLCVRLFWEQQKHWRNEKNWILWNGDDVLAMTWCESTLPMRWGILLIKWIFIVYRAIKNRTFIFTFTFFCHFGTFTSIAFDVCISVNNSNAMNNQLQILRMHLFCLKKAHSVDIVKLLMQFRKCSIFLEEKIGNMDLLDGKKMCKYECVRDKITQIFSLIIEHSQSKKTVCAARQQCHRTALSAGSTILIVVVFLVIFVVVAAAAAFVCFSSICL